ncbi:MFS transporter [Streptomyces sp. NPDC001594]|uniref:MFS transporter n=1 Tax=Streptomyces sp. NPDC001594 TaxID=3364590 RepID=UPI0036C5A143
MVPPDTRVSVSFTWKEKLGLLAAALSVLIVQLDWLAVNLALPRIAHEFSQSVTDLQWVLTGFMLAFGGLLPVAGWLADAYGRRRMTIYGVLVFIVSSLICATSRNVEWLVTGRVLQGAAGAFIVPGSIAMISGAFEGRLKSTGLAFVLGAAGTGAAFGPLVGGVLSEFNWRYVFLVNLPIGLLALPLIQLCVRPSYDPAMAARRPLLVSAGAVVAGFAGITVAVDRGPTWGWAAPATLVCTIGGVALLLLFVFLEVRGARPLHEREFYLDPAVQLLTVVGALSLIAYSILSTFSVIYLEEAQRLRPLAAGILLLALSVPDAAASYAAGKVAESRYAYVCLCAASAATALGIMLVVWADTVPLYVAAFAVCGLGIGLTGALTNVLIQHRAAPQRAGAAVSLSLAAKMLASAVAVALAATSLETLNGRVHGAGANRTALEAVLRVTALLIASGFLLLLPRALRAFRTLRGGPEHP